MTTEIVHSLVLITAIILGFIFPKTGLAAYDLQFSAGLFIFLYAAKKLVKSGSYSRLIESVVFTLITLFIVNSTGGITSPFFFLIYFLLFSLALILKPLISFTATFSLIIFFLLSIPQNQSIRSFLPIISLAFLTPFALYMGQEHLEAEKSKIKNQKQQEDAMLFITLMIKNHVQNIKNAAENFLGDHELEIIKKSARRMEKLIEKYEEEK